MVFAEVITAHTLYAVCLCPTKSANAVGPKGKHYHQSNH